jgi:hypothetical protein
MGRKAAGIASTSNPSSLKGIAESSSRLENMNPKAELNPHAAFNAGKAIAGKNAGLSPGGVQQWKKVGESTKGNTRGTSAKRYSRPQNEEDVDNSKSTWVGADAVEPSFFLRPIYVVFVWIMFGNRDLDFASGLRLRNFLDFGLGFQLGLSKVLQLYPSYGSRIYNKWSRVAQLYVDHSL